MSDQPILRAEGLVKEFGGESFLRRGRALQAVVGVDLVVARAEVLALVGESGSGKSTLARMLLRLERPTVGRVVFDDVDVWKATRAQRLALRRWVQPVFQDPYSTLDPRWTVERSVREALDAHKIGTPAQRRRRVDGLLDRVGLPARFAERLPGELSGGQLQRVCIAAALASEPRLLVADEPVTALDVSVQAQVLNLLAEIQRDLGLSILLVSHDLSVVAHLAHRVAVMYLGRIVESGAAPAIFSDARHPYTQALLAASPKPDPRSRPETAFVRGDLAFVAPDEGCPFHPRCPHAVELCRHSEPPLESVGSAHAAACHVRPEAPAPARVA